MADGDVADVKESLANLEIKENGTDDKSPRPNGRQRPDKKIAQHKVYLPDTFKTFVIDSTKAFDCVVKIFRRDIKEFRIISVDTETTSNAFAGCSGRIDVLQIGTLNGRAFIFRLAMMKSSETNYLRNILADPSIMKIGSLFHGDSRRLVQDWDIYVNNWIDIQNLALNSLSRNLVRKSEGLRNMTKTFVGVELNLFEPQSMGNWNVTELSEPQMNYASSNVMAVLDIFCSVYANRMRLTSVSVEDIKQHVAWTTFYSYAFRSVNPAEYLF